ncbi:transposase [Streptomyces sp. SID5998]|nr:transposase [Streptomyces sp. SID5998]
MTRPQLAEARRVRAAELFGQGRTNAEIARLLEVSAESVRRWKRVWEEGGTEPSYCPCSTPFRRSGVCGGCPRRKPRRLYADRGYDFDKYRRLLWKCGIKPMIARRGVAHGSGLGKVRWVVERAFAWLHQFKRLRTRYERRADLHQGLLELACSLICLRACEPHPEAISWRH